MKIVVGYLRSSAHEADGRRESWAVYERRWLLTYRRLGYVNARSAGEAISKGAEKFRSARRIVALLKGDE